MDADAARIASAIGEPARARILYCLMDGRARTSTELAIFAEVGPSTASVHLHKLTKERLTKVFAQGKHRYYSLDGPHVANVLEALSVLAGKRKFTPNTPLRLRAARTCYDHIAGTAGVELHDRLQAGGWIENYTLTPKGRKQCEALGIDVGATLSLRRRFAYPCLDWSERRPHIGGALGAALLQIAIKQKWVVQDLDSRALTINPGYANFLRRT